MEWLIGIYTVVGVFKTLSKFGNPNPALKPVWMLVERNPLKFILYCTVYVFTWSLAS